MLRICMCAIFAFTLAAAIALWQADGPFHDSTSFLVPVAAQSPVSAPAQEKPEAVGMGQQDTAMLTGRVTYTGPAIAPRRIQIMKDEEVCSNGNTQIPVLELSDNGGLANAVIELQGIDEPTSGWKWDEPTEGFVLRQKNCEFHPALLVMPNGKDLSVFNDDPIAHNVNTGQFNQMQPGGASPIKKQIRSRRPIRVTCNIHNWMEGWIYPAQSPFFAVSDKDGAFSIENVPSGKYRGTAWHPYLGKQRLRVTLSDGETRLDIQFKKK